ncbi:MAG TPA: hypothetical protein H9845_04585 [Candidatus Agathobaculum pullicola]|nr:hypothetical protein [Candidatus Agathobaculum pullicola]
MFTNKALEQRLRRNLMKNGYAMHKSHRNISADNLGGYMIIYLNGNYIVAGSRFELSLEDVQEWLDALH